MLDFESDLPGEDVADSTFDDLNALLRHGGKQRRRGGGSGGRGLRGRVGADADAVDAEMGRPADDSDCDTEPGSAALDIDMDPGVVPNEQHREGEDDQPDEDVIHDGALDDLHDLIVLDIEVQGAAAGDDDEPPRRPPLPPPVAPPPPPPGPLLPKWKEDAKGFVRINGKGEPIGRLTIFGTNVSARCSNARHSPKCSRAYAFTQLPSADLRRCDLICCVCVQSQSRVRRSHDSWIAICDAAI